MALTQLFPEFKLKSVPGDLQELPNSPEFQTFGFRKGGDLGYMADKVCESGNYLVDAAPGTGKSTDFPQAIVARTDALVVHVMPFPQLAAHLAEWHEKREKYRTPVFLNTLEDEIPTGGYVITYAALVVARWLQHGLDSFAGAILLQDESHESGAASAVIRRLAPHCQLKSYVALSATHTGGTFRALETRGVVADRQFTPESFVDPWSVLQEGAPWSVDRIGRCTLIYEDDDRRASELMSAYNLNGVTAMRWTAKTPVDKFLADVHLIRNMDHMKFVILADSTYRSGYTLPVQTIIDSGYVRRIVDTGDGAFRQVSRRIYQFEKHQTMARGGRTIGLSSSYYRPSHVLEAKRCIMEQTDVEAYVLILRMLGYSAFSEYPQAKFVVGLVPRDLCAALNNGVPLSSIVDYQLSSMSECVTLQTQNRAEQSFGDAEEVVENPAESVASNGPFTFDGVQSMLEDILEKSSERVELVPAEFGCPVLDSEKSRLLDPERIPDVVQSIRNYHSRAMLDNVVKFVWNEEERDMHFSVAASRYNCYLAKLIAIGQALGEIKTRPLDRDKVATTSWAKKYAELLVICQSEMKMWFEVAHSVTKKEKGFYKGPDIASEDIDSFKTEIFSTYEALPRQLGSLGFTSAYNSDKRLQDRFKMKMLEID